MKYVNQYKDLDFIYIRYDLSDRIFLQFLKRIKEHKPSIKILLEVPTYPYEDEGENDVMTYFYRKKDLCYRSELYKYIDRIITFSNHDIIFGIPTLKTINGIDINKICPVKPIEKEQNRIDLIVVSSMQKLHGYERIILGLKSYYEEKGERNIFLHMVGDGPQRRFYERLAKDDILRKQIFFYGLLSREKLDEIYDKADIGVMGLNIRKYGLNVVSALKSREYLAKGLPFVSIAEIDVLQNSDFKYFHKLDENYNITNIHEIVKFYDQIYLTENRETIISNMRKFAEETIDMNIALKPVVKFLNEIK